MKGQLSGITTIEFRILPQTPNGKKHKHQQQEAKNLKDSVFPADGHQMANNPTKTLRQTDEN